MDNFTLLPLIIIVLLALLALVFRKPIKQSLVLRIATIIFATGFTFMFVVTFISSVFFNNERPQGIEFQIAGLLVALGIPFLLAFLTSRLVNRPLRDFNIAIRSLETNRYRTKLAMSGINEFDQVFADFNSLIARLKKEEDLRKNLISDTSHELNTPLTAMVGQLVAMQEGTLPITKQRIATLKGQTDRLIDLVNQLDAYTKARAGDNDHMMPVAVRQTCEQVFSAMESMLKEHAITYEIRIAKELRITADAAALKQILTNLIQNTCRYANASKITVVASSHGLTYSDNGNGVPAESLPHLFERFYRVDPSRNRDTGGLGLGLSIVCELVERHGWSVTAEPAHPGLAIVIKF